MIPLHPRVVNQCSQILIWATAIRATIAATCTLVIVSYLPANIVAILLGFPSARSILGPFGDLFHVPMFVFAIVIGVHSPIAYRVATAPQWFRDAASLKPLYVRIDNIIHSMLHHSGSSANDQSSVDSDDATLLAAFVTHAVLLLAAVGCSYQFGYSWESRFLPFIAALLMYAVAILTLLGAHVIVAVLAWWFKETDEAVGAATWVCIAWVVFSEFTHIAAVKHIAAVIVKKPEVSLTAWL